MEAQIIVTKYKHLYFGIQSKHKPEKQYLNGKVIDKNEISERFRCLDIEIRKKSNAIQAMGSINQCWRYSVHIREIFCL